MAVAIGLSALLACGPARGASQDVADMDITDLVNVRVSPFDVATHLDRGYRASNSVSGSRFDAPIRDLPFAIQAFTEAFIDDQKPVTIHDVARYSPGVTYRSNDFNEGAANLAIRGFAVSSIAGAPQVLRDGFHGPSIFDFTNVSRVEVLKGPSSFLYGQVAPGGMVNLITKSPQPRWGATAELTGGSYGQHRAEADLTGPLGGGLFFRLAGSQEEDIHYWKPYDAQSTNFSPSLLWQPSERASVSLKYERYRKLESPQVMQKPGRGRQGGLLPTEADPNWQGVDVPGLPDDWNSMSNVDHRRSEAEGLSAWVDLVADEHWNLRLGHADQHYLVDALASGNFGMPNNTTFLQGRRLRKQTYTNWGETWSADAVGHYHFDLASVRLLFGAQQVGRRFDNVAAQAPNDPDLGNDPIASPLPLWDLQDPSTWNRVVDIPLDSLTANPTNRRSDYTDQSVYAGSTFGFFDDRLLLLAGWRQTSTRSRLTDHVFDRVDHLSARRVTPQYGALYKFGSGLAAFASYAESFVPGSQVLRHPDGSSGPAAPSQGRGYDLGLKADLLDGRVSGTLTLFDLHNTKIVNDLAQTNSDGSVVIYSVQSGEQRSRGVELDATVTAADNWQVYLSYSAMDARITEFSGRDAEILAQDPSTLDAAGQLNYKNVSLLHGARLQMSAPQQANVWARFDAPAGGWAGSYLAGGVNWVHDQTLLPDSPAWSRQSYALLNALAGRSWALSGCRVAIELMGKNLTGERYRPSQSTRARPREFLLTVKASL
ncbi:MAG TPA: TonB-dependent receptor [Ideonella sp.]|nr:TonB-dependent receptor [Ideonella sp.]